ncbi:MAG: PAS domain-containing protein [Spirochaetota bacterium]|nr:MAG: PAS domain-containing protein [Spirochaetota bacterium]
MKGKSQNKSRSDNISRTEKNGKGKNHQQWLMELRESEKLYRTVADFTYDWEYWLDRNGQLLYVSPSCERITGYKREEFIKKPSLVQEIIVAKDKGIWHEHRFSLEKKIESRDVQFRIHKRNGQICWIEHVCQPVINEKGSFFGFRVSNRDITERKQMEESLRISRSNLNRAQEVAHLGSWYLDLIKNELLWSDEIYRIFGVNLGSAMTYEKFLEIVHPEDREYVDDSWKAALDGKPYDIEHRIIVSGELKWVREKAEIEFNEEGKAVSGIGTVQDITDRKQAEEDSHRLREELMHVSRVAAMGELTAALAHELNQPLAAILSNAQAAQRFLMSEEPDLDEIREIISDIVKDDKRASEVIIRIRALLRRSDFEFTKLNINKVIEEVIPLVSSDSVIKNIALSTELDDKIPLISGDRIQLQQVILNLILNGFEAMMKVNVRSLCIHTTQNDQMFITVSVEDSGVGIEEKNQDHLFKPFFTTKKDGMGMGLAINGAIIEAHGGHLWAKNNPDQGATFCFTLPVCKEHSK